MVVNRACLDIILSVDNEAVIPYQLQSTVNYNANECRVLLVLS